MMVDPMFMIIQSLRYFLTAVTQIAVIFSGIYKYIFQLGPTKELKKKVFFVWSAPHDPLYDGCVV